MLDAARALLCGKTEREAHEARRVGDAQLPEFDDLDGRARAALARATAETARLKGA